MRLAAGNAGGCRITGASSRSEDDAVGSSPGVRRELTEDIGSLPRWRKEVHRKKTETRRKIVGGSRKAYWEWGRRLTAVEPPRLMAVEPPRSTVEPSVPYF
ncbi:hypothetical protein BHM03_00040600 [Ensete ventricosum]|nr:hypothetical protein BHM03_00040600 [Ensete ventricosum]